eukprot:CAMPEP_0172555360 /NCGR_PEP_ID=MMETSP1067-20121228/58375_1 /TAXON_ID=265564 ORGANISM="Thalassiosira punctigera, Strain Tpunct2005C2" /NCGR_SAMPLE_ID=MMETSP1067 /ASSEMBLY_ACC=CAM_ASM_000444 /LENGTH=80 /DNA_ID=CAMNT_0013343875 /DNA_START=142 /DNA_END=385 /DNA_ORIENTATION=-
MAVVEDAATIIRPSLGDYVGVDNNRWDDDNIGTLEGGGVGGNLRGSSTREDLVWIRTDSQPFVSVPFPLSHQIQNLDALG